MRTIIITMLAVTAVCWAVTVWATATSETGDTRAVPCVAYGKTSAGVLTAIQVDASGVLQLS